MHAIFHGQQYSSAHRTPDEQNARLATHIALFLRATQERTGHWKASHLGNELRYTCQALEALHLLSFQAFHSIIDSGVHWLINLSEAVLEDSEEWSTVRLHPSRFKTLAKLGAFADDQVQAEFAELCDRVSGQGLLNGVMQDPLLGAMIVADSLLELGNQAQYDARCQAVADPILARVQAELDLWCANPGQRDRDRLINSIGDASYALDVLLRSGRLATGDAVPEIIRQAMLDELERHETNMPLSKDTIYTAIQLGTHFNHLDETHTNLQPFFRSICVRYDRNQIQRDERNVDMQPLVLRALLTYSGAMLREHMITQMLDSAFDAISQSQMLREAERNRQFELLVRRRAKIEIRDVVELSGGITDARVFRISYAVNADGLSETGEPSRSHPQIHSIVVKSGTRMDLQQSVERFKGLRADIQPYFAQHSRQPEVLEASPLAPAYLILEDLTENYATLRQIFLDVDRHKLSADDRKTIAAVTQVVTQSLFDIYRRTRRKDSDLVGLQVSRLYLGRLDRALIAMCMPEKFPRLKELFRGFWLGDTRFESIERYQSLLYHHRETLRPPCLMLMHGDCHGRNVMLDDCYERIKLIDLDKLDYTGDYIMDIALLIEDVTLFRRLFDDSYAHYLRPEQVELPADATHVAYPSFICEAAILFQQLLVEQVSRFADEIKDRHFKPRLWLAIAMYLLRLVEKAEHAKTGAVLYVEAVKLLHALVEHLQTGKPLPTIPIMRDAQITQAMRGVPQPVTSLDADMEPLHQLLLACAEERGLPLRPALRVDGRSVRYFLEQETEPYAMLDGKRRPPGILLRCRAEVLEDVNGYVEPIRSTGVFSSVMRPPVQYDVAIVRELLLRALV
jgi:hypothetical protein